MKMADKLIDLDELEKLEKAAREDWDGPVWQEFWDRLSEGDVLTLIDRVRGAEAELVAVKVHREKWMARAFRAETERDDALARITEAAKLHSPAGQGTGNWPCRTAKALGLNEGGLDD